MRCKHCGLAFHARYKAVNGRDDHFHEPGHGDRIPAVDPSNRMNAVATNSRLTGSRRIGAVVGLCVLALAGIVAWATWPSLLRLLSR
jgi:hypothetical protein